MSKKSRVDQLLVERDLAPSRARAQALIMAGAVYTDTVRIEKPGQTLAVDAPLSVRGEDHAYVSRGGVKLAGALDGFAVDVAGKRCLDVGASTGGFTDCLLQRGADQVIAVDVGYGQLAHKLRVDPRVVSMERTNARTLTAADIGGAVDLVVVDASFIGLGKLMQGIAACTKPGGELVALVKPQFEVGKAEATRSRGVVRDDEVRSEAIALAIADVAAVGFVIKGHQDCVIEGPKGNREAFVYAAMAARGNEEPA